jgi:KDO2-lipid IV(A) lauroyltransferase
LGYGRQKNITYNKVVKACVDPFLYVVKRWPLWFARPFSWCVTAAYYPFVTRVRKNYQSNLRHILGPEASGWTLFRKNFRMLVNYAYYLIDLFSIDDKRKDELSELLSDQTGYDRLQRVLSGGGGAIMMTAHLGNWEMGGSILSKLGHPVNIVYVPDKSGSMEKERTRARLMAGVKEIRLEPGAMSPITMLKVLRNGEIVALQGDKLYGDPGMKVDFFGSPAYFPKGPVTLSLVSGAPIVPSFIVMDKDAKYKVILDEPIYPENTGDREADTLAMLKRVAAVMEKYIAEYHEQWYCYADFWAD